MFHVKRKIPLCQGDFLPAEEKPADGNDYAFSNHQRREKPGAKGYSERKDQEGMIK